jgi:glycosyltransferase involved in cell wall biosynthesis
MSTSTKLASALPAVNLPDGGRSDGHAHSESAELQVALMTGGFDRHYAYGMSMALTGQGVRLEVIGSDEVDSPEMHASPEIDFLNWQHRGRRDATVFEKIICLLGFYARLGMYAARTKSCIFHILWNNKFVYLDRTLLMLYFKALGKRIALTAHNVNTAKRDGNDSRLNRLTLRAQYRLVDRIFVHTQKMREELISDFGVRPDAVTIIPYGINNAVPNTELTPAEAKRKLGLSESERVILFFGRIQPYKGLEYLVEAMELLMAQGRYRLIIAGEPKKEHVQYWSHIQRRINSGPVHTEVLQKIEYIADEDAELYFKAADALVLPYTDIYQSGVLFLGYSFGLPAIATDVGSFQEEIVQGETGLVCKCSDSNDLARTIEAYFASSLYAQLNDRRQAIKEYAYSRCSWHLVGNITVQTYKDMEREKGRELVDVC